MEYYSLRKDLPYYQIVRDYLAEIGPVDSLLDVGSADTPAATWGQAKQRFAVDRRAQPPLDGVRQIQGHWPDVRNQLPPAIDVVLCLQVLEHVPDVRPFADALFDLASTAVILSVPFCWQPGRCDSHVHDPIDLAKLHAMTGQTPRKYAITKARRRLVAIYRIV